MLKVADCNVIWIKCRNVFCYVKYTLYLSYKTKFYPRLVLTLYNAAFMSSILLQFLLK